MQVPQFDGERSWSIFFTVTVYCRLQHLLWFLGHLMQYIASFRALQIVAPAVWGLTLQGAPERPQYSNSLL